MTIRFNLKKNKKKSRIYFFLPRTKLRIITAARAPIPIANPRINPRIKGSNPALGDIGAVQKLFLI